MVNSTIQSISTTKTPPYPAVISDDPQVIRTQIERTRAEMGQTLDEIQVRLSPDYIKQQTQDSIREATIEKVEKMAQTAEYKVKNWRSNAVQTVKENPIPAALVGIGLGWLLLSDSNGRSESYDERYSNSRLNDPNYSSYGGRRYDNRPYDYESSEPGRIDEAQEWASDTATEVQRKAQNVTASVKQQAEATTEAVRDNVSNMAESAQEYAAETAEQVQARAEQARIQANRQVRQVKRSFWHTMEENPLAIGAAAIAAGALIGLALPSTEKENELMGETRDRLMEDASSTVQETMHKVQTVAETTAKTAVTEAKKEAENQNLSISTMGEKTDDREMTSSPTT